MEGRTYGEKIDTDMVTKYGALKDLLETTEDPHERKNIEKRMIQMQRYRTRRSTGNVGGIN